jgi:hypothetical protein
MYPIYRDIREAMGTPKWIDKHGVPRYSEFHPQDAADIYGDWVALMTVECQACGKTFQCANSISHPHHCMRNHRDGNFPANDAPSMIPIIAGWGDAPWHDNDGNECTFDAQCSGTTMSTDWTNLRVWHKDWRSKGNEFDDWVEISDPECYLRDAPESVAAEPNELEDVETGEAK